MTTLAVGATGPRMVAARGPVTTYGAEPSRDDSASATEAESSLDAVVAHATPPATLWPMLASALPRLRRRLRAAVSAKGEAEIGWWLTHWEPAIRAGGFSPPDAAEILGEEPAETYEGRRWQQARAEVRRVLREAAIDDPDFFAGKVVVDVGPGPLGFPDACPARVSIGVEPLAQRYADAGLLLPDSKALYLAVGAEDIPLLDGSVDVVVARNSLDHVEDPQA